MSEVLTVDLETALDWSRTGAAGIDQHDAASDDDTDGGGPESGRRPDREAVDSLIAAIDLTTLEGADTPAKVAGLCRQARAPDPGDPGAPHAAAVCVYPSLVAVAVEHTSGSPVKVASVAGAFPSGLSPLPVRLADISAAVDAGADEVDIVLNRSAFLSGDLARVHGELIDSIEAARGRPVKVILEVGELGEPAAIYTAALVSMAAGASFVKSSTGKIPRSATPRAVSVMAEAAARFRSETGREVGIKVSGGVRTVEAAAAYRALIGRALGDGWTRPRLFRIGASGLLGALVAARQEAG